MSQNPELSSSPERQGRTTVSIDTELYKKLEFIRAFIDGSGIDASELSEDFKSAGVTVDSLIDTSIRGFIEGVELDPSEYPKS